MSLIKLKQSPKALQIFLIKSINKNNVTSLHKTALERIKFKGKFGEIVGLFETNSMFVGTDYKNQFMTYDSYAKPDYYALGAKVTRYIKKTNIKQIQINSLCNINSKELEHFLLGVRQGGYDFDTYMKDKTTVELEVFLEDRLAEVLEKENLEYIEAITNGVKLARNLVNETPQVINPTTMPNLIRWEFSGSKNIQIKEIPFKNLIEMGMDGIVAVGKASVHKPSLIHTILKPSGEVTKKIVLVGKGLTYDSGGMDIKGGGHMKDMKCDMAGSATMFGVTKALSLLNLKNTEVHWLSAFAENMIDGNAYKSDDILTTYSGLTVEIYNTDAEGRLTLADVLSYATLLDPTYIVDAATLTGACIVALTDTYTGLMSNNRDLSKKLLNKFSQELEPTTEVKLRENMRKAVKGKNSDLMNTSSLDRQAGHMTAGLFLSHFVEQAQFRNTTLNIKTPKSYPWVHLDIAGSAYNSKNNSLGVDGATGQSIRSLVQWILEEDRNN
jgi:leucyl aminopeptidase